MSLYVQESALLHSRTGPNVEWVREATLTQKRWLMIALVCAKSYSNGMSSGEHPLCEVKRWVA